MARKRKSENVGQMVMTVKGEVIKDDVVLRCWNCGSQSGWTYIDLETFCKPCGAQQ